MDLLSTEHPGSPLARWLSLGAGGAGGAGGAEAQLRLEGTELWWVELPFRAPVATSASTHRNRPLVLVRLRCRRISDGRAVDGWGESAALADATYDHEDVAGAFATLDEQLLPTLRSLAGTRDRILPPVGELAPEGLALPARPLACAALEMAVGDAHLRTGGLSFAGLLEVADRTVHPGAVLGLQDTAGALVEAAERARVGGYVRVKAKIAPGRALEVVETLAAWAEGVPGQSPVIQVDANGAYRTDQYVELSALDPFGLACIEQPFGRDDWEAHRRLADGMLTPICLDESLDGPERVVEAVTSGACSVVCVKPARLGGISSALETIQWCTDREVSWWIGGMFESGYGRRVTTALGALPGATLPGDLSLPSTYLTRDIVAPAVSAVDRSSGRLTVAVADTPGMGPPPDPGAPGVRLVARTQASL